MTPGATSSIRCEQADGSVLIVNRGFVPGTDAVPAGARRATVKLIGQLRRERDAAGSASRRTRPASCSPRCTASTSPSWPPQFGGDVEPMYLQLLQSEPAEGQYPANVAPPVLDDGPHLSYTIQWFIFSICAIVGWVLAVRRSAATRSGKTRKRRGPPPIADELSRVGPAARRRPRSSFGGVGRIDQLDLDAADQPQGVRAAPAPTPSSASSSCACTSAGRWARARSGPGCWS